MHPKRMEADLGFRDLGFASGVRFFGMWDWDFAKASKSLKVYYLMNVYIYVYIYG